MARRRTNRRVRNGLFVLVMAAVGIGVYDAVFFEPIREAGPPPESAEAAPASPAVPEAAPAPPPRAPALLAAETPAQETAPPSAATRPGTSAEPAGSSLGRAMLQDAAAALTQDRRLEAREKLAQALARGLTASELREARQQLVRLAEQDIFSPAITPNDPLVSAHVIKSGETLAKIAKQYQVTDDCLARINRIEDKNRIREGQRIKVLHGPFSAVVDRESFDMDVYLGGVIVKHYRVGLGTDGSTPSGKWRVHNKLMNPTYYPPRGGAIIAADDPENPLGERWIGLTGIEGEALGQARYGIHGTIEPESIGKNMSLGCIRLLNSDVDHLFELLVEEHSTVVIR